MLQALRQRLSTSESLSVEGLAQELGLSAGAVLDLSYSLGYRLADPTLGPTSMIGQQQREITNLRTQLADQKQLVKGLTQSLEQCERRQHHLSLLTTSDQEVSLPEVSLSSAELGEATAVLLASDWHVGERVDLSATHGLNEYNPDIARDRARRFFSNACKLVEKERHSAAIETLVLWLGGDLITGYLHEEQEESNWLSPVEESLLVQSLIKEGLTVLQQTVNRIVVVANYGNHGRTTKKKRISTGAQNSYEWLCYQQLSQQLSEVEWHIAGGYFNYLSLYDDAFRLRFHHGDGVKYQGGIGGVTIPLLKFINRCNTQRQVDLDVVGHFHSLLYHNQFVVNGSLIGVTPYSLSLGCPFERPQQGFFVVERSHGIITQAPVLVL